jgi:hypothetical protein
MKIMYEASDGKLFENEAEARQHESLYNDIKYYHFSYDENWQAKLQEEKIRDNDEYDSPIEKALVEAEVIFIPNMQALNAICSFFPELMPDFDNSSFVPHAGFYAWVESEDCFVPVAELSKLSDKELEMVLWQREDINRIRALEKEYYFENEAEL